MATNETLEQKSGGDGTLSGAANRLINQADVVLDQYGIAKTPEARRWRREMLIAAMREALLVASDGVVREVGRKWGADTLEAVMLGTAAGELRLLAAVIGVTLTSQTELAQRRRNISDISFAWIGAAVSALLSGITLFSSVPVGLLMLAVAVVFFATGWVVFKRMRNHRSEMPNGG